MTSTDLAVKAPGKINLCLAVGAPDSNGYHPLATVFQAVGLYETVTVSPAAGGELSLELTGPCSAGVPLDGRNLALRAASLLRERHGEPGLGAHLRIDKQVPVAGGMGGGSADAAATLLALSHLWDLNLGRDRLMDLGSELGADIPFALLGHTAIGSGYGDVLTPALCRPEFTWVIAERPVALSTPAVYAECDRLRAGRDVPAPTVGPDLMHALLTGDAEALGRQLDNDLQAAAFSLDPDLPRVLEAAEVGGALGAVVSGSGPSVAVLAEDAAHARSLQAALMVTGLVSQCHRLEGSVPGARLI